MYFLLWSFLQIFKYLTNESSVIALFSVDEVDVLQDLISTSLI